MSTLDVDSFLAPKSTTTCCPGAILVLLTALIVYQRRVVRYLSQEDQLAVQTYCIL